MDCEDIICCICATEDHKSHDLQHFSKHFEGVNQKLCEKKEELNQIRNIMEKNFKLLEEFKNS